MDRAEETRLLCWSNSFIGGAVLDATLHTNRDADYTLSTSEDKYVPSAPVFLLCFFSGPGPGLGYTSGRGFSSRRFVSPAGGWQADKLVGEKDICRGLGAYLLRGATSE